MQKITTPLGDIVAFVCGTEAHLCRDGSRDSYFTFTADGHDNGYACMREPKDMDMMRSLSEQARAAGAQLLIMRGMHARWAAVVDASALPVVEVSQWKRQQPVEDCRRIYGDGFVVWHRDDSRTLNEELDPAYVVKPYQFL